METGSELSKTVATFIVQKLLLDEMGLTYICATAERFYAVLDYQPHLSMISGGRVVSRAHQPAAAAAAYFYVYVLFLAMNSLNNCVKL